jgi:hypothetical protein
MPALPLPSRDGGASFGEEEEDEEDEEDEEEEEDPASSSDDPSALAAESRPESFSFCMASACERLISPIFTSWTKSFERLLLYGFAVERRLRRTGELDGALRTFGSG